MSYTGKYQVKHREKYRGDASKVTYRSLWELHIMKHLDFNPHVKWWCSEETVVPYFSIPDQKKRRYFMDFTVCYNDGSMYLWEVKPKKQAAPPVPPKRMDAKTKERFANEIYTWQTNLCKWQATTKLCKSKGWTFKIITEDVLRSRFGMKL